MKITTFDEIIKKKNEFDSLLKVCNIPIVENDRIHSEYKLISEFNKIIGDIEKVHNFRALHGANNEIEYGLFDLVLIHYCLENLIKCDKKTLKKKINDILKMSDPCNESVLNNQGRNTLFELLFYSYLKSAGIDAELCDPNPDIKAKFENRTYFVQCKRVFSLDNKAIRSNVLDALRQLNTDLKTNGNNNLGIIALSVERFFTEGNKMLLAENEEIAREELFQNLKNITNKYGKYWQDKSQITDKKIVAIFLHHLAMTNILEKPRLSVGHFILMNNTIYPETKEFIQAKKDFYCLKSFMS